MSSNVVQFAPRTTDTDQADGLAAPVLAMTDRAVYTVKEVAHLLSLSLGSTYALVRQGEIPALKMGGRWIVPKKRFHTWLDSCMVPADSAPWPDPGLSFGNRRPGGA
jgi:excisionase family DNA binding protein